MKPHPTDEFSLYDLITANEFEEYVLEVRQANPAKQKELKMELPAFTPSGLFSKKRMSNLLTKHSGFICIDIDFKDNEHISNFKDLKAELRNIINIAFVAHSVSGKGYYALIPIEDTTLHEQYYIALEEAFSKLGIVIDKSCKDVARARIVSDNSNYYIANIALPISNTLKTETNLKQFEYIDNDKFNATIKEIENRQVDITKEYNDWFAIGCSFANTFDEEGRAYFHKVSQFYPKYEIKKADEQYSACIKNKPENGYTLGTFYFIASKYGII